MMTKNLTILGSTGSIGRQTLEVVEQLPVRVAALTAGQNVERMAEQCRRFRPQLAVMGTEEAAQRLREALAGEKIEIRSGMDGLIAAAEHPLADTVVTAVVGMLGLRPTLAAIRVKKRIALANKETLVCAGELVMREAAAAGAEIVPVDSEHSAIFQCLMGCATLMNKGLEVIEAMRLYGLPLSQVDVVIHRQSIVHSLVEFRDGAVLAQLGVPDMRVPIRLALT